MEPGLIREFWRMRELGRKIRAMVKKEWECPEKGRCRKEWRLEKALTVRAGCPWAVTMFP